MRTKGGKYNSRAFTNAFGRFDSLLEYRRYLVLKAAEDEGCITGLQRQVPYVLVPKQCDESGRKPRMLEEPVKYIADFVYTDYDGVEVVEDTKGVRTAAYVIKRKLMLLQGHPVREVDRATEVVGHVPYGVKQRVLPTETEV